MHNPKPNPNPNPTTADYATDLYSEDPNLDPNPNPDPEPNPNPTTPDYAPDLYSGCTKFYPNTCRCFAPAFRNRKTKDLEYDQISDANANSSDRYVVEVVYRRVKTFRILRGHVDRGFMSHVGYAWHVGHMFANFYAPLRCPIGWDKFPSLFEKACTL